MGNKLSLLGSTKREILDLLRRSPSTIHDVAATLNVTDNAVRMHVVALERDRLIEQRGRRPGIRKPSIVYGLTAVADQLFAKPYGAVLNALLDEVTRRRGDEEVAGMAGAIGQALARERTARVANLTGRERVDAVVDLINELGGLMDVEEEDGHLRLEGYSCPLVAIVPRHPQMCKVAQAFIEDLLGDGPVRELCERGENVRCRFEVAI